jgi:hypothetical protein
VSRRTVKEVTDLSLATCYRADMRQSEFDKISAALDRAEFALEVLQKKASELCRKLASAKTPEESETLNLESIELKQQLRKIREAVHAASAAPHLRLVSDSE